MKIEIAEAHKKLKTSGQLFIDLFSHGTMSVELYKPKIKDLQTPHEQDEIYVIAEGSSEFINNGITTSVTKGDLVFVHAGHEHRFFNFSDDFSTWVIFYGPKGGEK